jgi:ABC-type phosphate transport system permease subunit
MTIFMSIIVGLGLFFIISFAARAGLKAAARAHHRPMFRDMPLTASFGLAVIVVYVVVAILAPAIAPFGEGEVLGDQYLPWGSPYYLGTDKLGRDMLTRLIYGARNTVGIAFATTALAFVVGGIMLGLGRALGETMAVTFVIGNANRLATSLFAPGNSIASTLANEFAEAAPGLHVSSLFALGLVLFLITFIVLAAAKLLIQAGERAAGSK